MAEVVQKVLDALPPSDEIRAEISALRLRAAQLRRALKFAVDRERAAGYEEKFLGRDGKAS